MCNPPFCLWCREKTSQPHKKKNEKIHSLYRAFCVGKRSRSSLATENASSVRGANGWGRTLEVSFAEATVDVKENIFVFAVCLSICFVRKWGRKTDGGKRRERKKSETSRV